MRVDSTLQARYYRVNYDTAFIGRPQQRLTLRARAKASGNSLHTDTELEGKKLYANLHTKTRATLYLGANYRGISAGVSLNPASFKKKNSDYEFNVNIFTNRYNIEASYQDAHTLSGTIKIDGTPYHIPIGLVHTKIFQLTGCYTFNHRRFSWPAAFTQSYIQKRSAGSWLIGFAYQAGSLKINTELFNEPWKGRIYMGDLAVGGGYAHNFVWHRKWLVHLSLIPMLIVLNRNNITVNGERIDFPTHFPEMLLSEHLAVVYNFSHKYFLCFNAKGNSNIFVKNKHYSRQSQWQTQLSFGMRI